MENNENKVPKKFYKQWWFIALAVVVVLIIIGSSSEPAPTQGQNSEINSTQEQTTSNTGLKENEPDVPREYQSALNKASAYANTMHMSKRNVYEQLISEYGEKFTAEAAQYAVDNVTADWNANALVKAKNYQNTMNMSPAAIHDQLISDYGEKFTVSEADYAIENLDK